MTRDQLRPLEGQAVIICGRISSHCLRGDFFDVSYENCKVWPYRTDVPQFAGEPIEVDHLWEIAPPKINKVGEETTAVGRVYWYTRADGSLDLSIKRYPAIDLYDALEALMSRVGGLDDAEQLTALRFFRKQADRERKRQCLLFQSEEMSVNDVLKQVDLKITRLERNVRSTAKAMAGAFAVQMRASVVRKQRATHSFAAMAGGAA